MEKDILQYAVRCFQDEAQAIYDLIPQLTEDFVKAVNLILKCEGRLIVTGVGKSGHVGAKIAATLASTGTPSFFVNPLDAYHGDLGMFTENDVVMAISYSGQTDELLRFIPLLQERRIPIIGVTGDSNSLLARCSVCHLDIHVSQEADPLNLAPTSSTTATMVMGDALACALEGLRNFKASDFAQFHPGGSLGRKLLAKVKDVMSTNIPIVSPEMNVNQALLKISEGKVGLAVVTENDKLLGVVSDGDIRRAFQRYKKDAFDIKVKTIMSKNPIVVGPSEKLVRAEELLVESKRNTLLVVNDDNECVGLFGYMDCKI